MNEKDQAIFDRIVKLDPVELTDYELAFLNARRGYLTTDQKRIFDSVLIKEVDQDLDDEVVAKKKA